MKHIMLHDLITKVNLNLNHSSNIYANTLKVQKAVFKSCIVGVGDLKSGRLYPNDTTEWPMDRQ